MEVIVPAFLKNPFTVSVFPELIVSVFEPISNLALAAIVAVAPPKFTLEPSVTFDEVLVTETYVNIFVVAVPYDALPPLDALKINASVPEKLAFGVYSACAVKSPVEIGVKIVP